ncbi:hypothetical protein J6590_056065 [Homalodisca vitripennis]|nr:hypothetical protein J6590_056065 [Homalodisca vitripennis]
MNLPHATLNQITNMHVNSSSRRLIKRNSRSVNVATPKVLGEVWCDNCTNRQACNDVSRNVIVFI